MTDSPLRRLEDDARRMFHGKPNKEQDVTTPPTTPTAGDPAPTPEVLAAAQQLVAQQAAGVSGTDSAGIFGDPAGAAQHTAPQTDAEVAAGLQAKGATPAQADLDQLLTLIQSQADALKTLQAQVSAAGVPVEAAPPKPPVLEEILSSMSGIAPGVVHALTVIASRLDAAGI